jgi:hypothetical protein
MPASGLAAGAASGASACAPTGALHTGTEKVPWSSILPGGCPSVPSESVLTTRSVPSSRGVAAVGARSMRASTPCAGTMFFVGSVRRSGSAIVPPSKKRPPGPGGTVKVITAVSVPEPGHAGGTSPSTTSSPSRA